VVVVLAAVAALMALVGAIIATSYLFVGARMNDVVRNSI
jgi:hypothetical protein